MLGGTAASVFHDKKGIQQLLRPNSLGIHPSLPLPPLLPPMTFRERLVYSSWERRGYLHPEVRTRLCKVDPTFERRYLMVEPIEPISKPTFNLKNIPAELRKEGLLPA